MVPIVGNRLFLHRNRFLSQATRCVPQCKNQNHYCHTNNQLHKSCDSQTCSTFLCSNSYLFYTYAPDIPICYYVYGVHESLMSLNVLIISFVFLWVRGPAHSENTQCYVFSVGLPRTVCAFVSLTRDNMIEQYILTRSSKHRGQILSKHHLTAASKNFGSNDIQIVRHWIIHST